jgi:cell division septation protein DedD
LTPQQGPSTDTPAVRPAPPPRPAAAAAAPDPAPPTRVASVASGTEAGGYSVQLSSQRSESEAQASFRALQTKFPALLSARQPVIRRADLGDKGIYFRTLVGPFTSQDEATGFCGSLKSAGGQCVVQRN